ncbi:glycosyltransferase family 1 [Sporolactobacillus laevolacticus DSM 442]|uniref:Glycosyltransferase family 1 n=2 Tax=Sporolactobacillus laevolacticus TaxID=33018 RepID=V6J7G9_9BACL|nr:glycosyltransferase family 1 [Sporolactobacillus laevolacticus DSM 442]
MEVAIEMKRVLVYGLGTSVGGMEEYIMNLFRTIDRSKYVFDIIPHGGKFFYAEQEVNQLGGKVYKITGQKQSLYGSMKELNKLLKNLRSSHEIIYFNSCGFYNILPFVLAKKYHYTIITHGHNSRDAERSVLVEVLHCINRIYVRWISKYRFACSKAAGEWIFGKHYFHQKKVKIINNAIDCEKFRFRERIRQAVRKQLNVENDLVIGHVGRFVYQKNHDFLIDLFHAIHQRNEKSKLLLIGEGELRSKIEEKVKDLGLDDGVLFLGNRKDIPELMWAMDLFVLPSRFEGLPVVAVEAQAAGLPLILSDTISEETRITKLVTFCSLKNPLSYWEEAVLSGISKHRDMEKEIKSSGFDIKDQANKFVVVLDRLIQ